MFDFLTPQSHDFFHINFNGPTGAQQGTDTATVTLGHAYIAANGYDVSW
jgi:hypothetical protein